MDSFSTEIDLRGALALFLLLDLRRSALPDRRRSEREALVGEAPELDALEAELRAFLYERLSIDEMEDPEALYVALAHRAALPGGRLLGERKVVS